MKILFICKYNRFRSQISEIFFNKINKNKDIIARSAGLMQGSYPLDIDEVEVAKEFGIDLQKVPEKVTSDMIKWADLIVITADDVMPSMLNLDKNKKKYVHLQIPDTKTNTHDEIRWIIGMIERKVGKLISEIK